MRVKNIATAFVRWRKAGKPTRTPERVQELLSACKACEYFKPDKSGSGGTCGLCGCYLNIGGKLNKLRWATESCPDGKWKADIVLPGYEVVLEDFKPRPLSRKAASADNVAKSSTQEAGTMGRRERRKARQERQRARAERIAQRELEKLKGDESPRAKRRAEKKARRDSMPNPIVFPSDTDNLKTYDRNEFELLSHPLRNIWRPASAFLVGGGPSTKEIDTSFLRDRGIMSLGINNIAGRLPVRAMTFSDPAEKFHHGIFFDPAILKLVPVSKLNNRVRAKVDGKFRYTQWHVRDCPNVFGYLRNSVFDPETFLTSEAATWGHGKDGLAINPERRKILFTFFLGLRLLHYLGVRRVYLLGVDFSMGHTNGGYAFEQARWGGAVNGNNSHYRLAIEMCRELRPVFEKSGFAVYQTNPHSSLQVFDYVSLDKAVADCRGLVPSEPFDLSQWYEKVDWSKPQDNGPVFHEQGE